MVYIADLGLILGKAESVRQAHTRHDGAASVAPVGRLGDEQARHRL